jgi:hypothetical protein
LIKWQVDETTLHSQKVCEKISEHAAYLKKNIFKIFGWKTSHLFVPAVPDCMAFLQGR